MKVVILLGAFVLSMLSINALSAEKPKDPWYEVSSNAAGDAKILAKLDTVKKDETGVSVLIQILVKNLPGGNFSVKYYQMSISKKRVMMVMVRSCFHQYLKRNKMSFPLSMLKAVSHWGHLRQNACVTCTKKRHRKNECL